jgi:putative Mg2+ transporter-C (MgtC) family protein
LDSTPFLDHGFGELSLRIGLATFVGALLGLDRELRGHDAGLRTHALVALSSAMITVSSLLLFDDLRQYGATPDPLRVVQGLAQAIGFIAAGIIFVRHGDVLNMTTAANIWMAAAIGIVAGAGQYRLLVVGSVLAIMLLSFVRVIERWLPGERKLRAAERETNERETARK